MYKSKIDPSLKSVPVVNSPQNRTFFAFFLLAVLTILAPSAHANQPPKAVAAAGVDPNTGLVLSQVTLFIGPADSGISHTISGGGSTDPDGDPLRYQWNCWDGNGNKCPFLQLIVVNVTDVRALFPAGTYYLTLTVTDPSGASSTDTATVKVLVDNISPTITPPDNESVSATEAGGARGSASSELHNFLFNSATASDNSTAIFTHLPPQVNGADVDDTTLFPHGTTTITFRIADNFGNVGTATADVFVTDLQSGDLFVGVFETVFTAFFADRKGVVKRIRGGSVTDFCVSPYSGGPVPIGNPVYWNRPDQIVVDSKGRVAFIAPLGFGGNSFPSLQNGWGLLRCNLPGQPAEQLGIFPQPSPFQGSYMDPGWPVPLPGKSFWNNSVTGGLTLTGLHLRKTKFVVIDDNGNNGNPQIVTEERYVFAYHESSIPGTFGSIGSLSLHTESLNWKENDLTPVGIASTPTGLQQYLPGMFFHSRMETVSFFGLSFPAPVAKTYVGNNGTLRRILQPFEVQLTANTSAGTVQFGVQAFAGFTEMPHGVILDDVTIPNPPSGCGIPPPGVRGDWPRPGGFGGGYTSLGLLGNGVIFEKNSGLVVNDASWFGHLDESLFDLDPQNDLQSHFVRPETGCVVEPVVNFTPLAGFSPGAYPPGAYHFDSQGGRLWPERMAASPNGLFGTIDAPGHVVQATGAVDLVDVATGLDAPLGLGAFPPQLGNMQISALIIRIDSPVDVVLADALGRRVGVSNGQAIDEFGGQAFDSGPQTHPRLYIIQFPQTGNYTVRSAGTGSGPFTVHVYSVDSEKKVTDHILHAGIAQPGSSGKHDFDLNAGGHVAFSNAAPVADAGFDQTADANASGNATFALDGSLSSDPDGDGLTFTWAGPFGILSGAQVNATLPVGVHVVKLTVDDGKGGSAVDTVQITVNAIAPPSDTTPPVLTLPANIVVQASSSSGAVVSFSATANDNVDGSVPITCVPPSGSTFAVGTTTVNCSATDASNNSAAGSFSVTVNPPSPTGAPQIVAALAGQGRISTDVIYVDLLLTNAGGGDAFNVSVRELQFSTLAGSGSVTRNSRRSALPILAGDIPAGASKTVRIYITAPASVTQFSLSTFGRSYDAKGVIYRFSFTQAITP
ncbi:MAG TPA: HYR domain-containing protein [Candidatus Acidoferrales bacterium]|nr:HYR domain-containing protein [Candidatus Acidoferrales bacterium]